MDGIPGIMGIERVLHGVPGNGKRTLIKNLNVFVKLTFVKVPESRLNVLEHNAVNNPYCSHDVQGFN